MATKVLTYHNRGMDAIDRCDRCGGQAYVEVTLNKGGTLMFCAHHATDHEDKIMALDAIIADHRPFLEAETTKGTHKLGLDK